LHKDPWKDFGAHSYALGLHKTPQKDVRPCNAVLGARGRWPRAIPATSPASSVGKWLGRIYGSRGLDLGAYLQRGGGRRARAVWSGYGRRGSGCSGEDVAGPRQQMKAGSSTGPREDACVATQKGADSEARRAGHPWRGGSSSARAQCARPASTYYLNRRGYLGEEVTAITHVKVWAWGGGNVRWRTTATPVVRWRGGRTRGASGVGEKGGEGAVQCPCACRVAPVGPVVVAGHMQLYPVSRRRGWHGNGTRRHAWARTRGAADLK
jgi:hypothetical protein